jgi:hypothetical protein
VVADASANTAPPQWCSDAARTRRSLKPVTGLGHRGRKIATGNSCFEPAFD